MQQNTTKNANLETTIARKLELENIGCAELEGSYKGFRFFWNPETGVTRERGGKPSAHNASQKELLIWVLARA